MGRSLGTMIGGVMLMLLGIWIMVGQPPFVVWFKFP